MVRYNGEWFKLPQKASPVKRLFNSKKFVPQNFTVHSFMYTYYAFRSIGIKVPKPLAMSITVMQITQMFVGKLDNLATFSLPGYF